ncbi:MAG TPA: HTTM domain-containing protein, partial [Myxococcota bacterium]
MIERCRTWLNAPVDAAALAAFRVAVGLMVTVSAVRFIVYGWVDDFFVKPTFFFKHLGFAWVPVPSSTTVHALFWMLVALGVLVTLGLFYRVAIVALFIGFSWVQLMDATNYLNHYYLVSLLLLLLSTMPLGDAYGLDGRRRRTSISTLPRWMTVVLRLQVGCVYFYAGLAKLDADWLLHAQPLGIWLTSRTSMPLVGPLLAQWWAPWLFSWCGFLFDTSIVFLLLWSRTRLLAYVAVVVFHSLTMALFPIGMFPVIMMVAALVFFSSSWPRRFVRLTPPTTTSTTTTPLQPATTTLLVAWAAVQLL